MIAFTVGALLPLLVVAFVPDGVRILVTVLSVVAALALTGFVSARIGYSPRLPCRRTQRGGRPARDGRDLPDRVVRRHPHRLS